EAAITACREPVNHRYSPTAGLPDLRAAIATKTKRDSGCECEAAQVLVTNGGKHAVYYTFQVLLDPGDEVLLPAPYWTTYPESIALADGLSVVIPTTEASGFRVTVEQLEAARTPRTKVLLFVSPSNPTGAVYPPDAVAALAAVSGDLSAVEEMRTHFERRGRVMHEMLSAIPGVSCLEPQGAFYCFPSFEGVLGREIAGRTAATTIELCELLLEEAKVAIVP